MKNRNKFFDRLDEIWRTLPSRKQQQYILYFFVGYLFLTTGVIFKVWCNSQSDNNLVIEHIVNPIPKTKQSPGDFQDTLQTILKNKIYEKK